MNTKQILVERHLKEMEKHTRKQKLRDARRKAGPKHTTKKPRQKRLSHLDWDEMDDLELETYAPILSRGERERRKEVEKQALRATQIQNSSGENTSQEVLKTNNWTSCLVVEAGSGMCRVDFNGETLLCEIRGNIKDAETGYINPVAVGDWVQVSRNGDDRGMVESVHLRHSVLSRPYAPDMGKIIEDLHQIVVANVDRLLIVASWREPYIWPALIDRYLITAQRNQIEAVLCINKVDLVEDQAEFEDFVNIYQRLDYRLVRTSAVTQVGIADLDELLADGTTVLAGLSGVGKSSLLVAVQPDLNLKTGKVSEHGLFTGQGRHTTTQTSLWQLKNGGVVVDTPGVRSFGIAGIAPSALAGWYSEIAPHVSGCRFGNCSHTNEPGCGVKAALERGEISALRYKNYTQLLDELNR
jgi:ribosome biogenesis GTPase